MEIKIRSLWLVIGILLFIAGGIPGLMAQTSSVTVEFFVQPFPSPYLSDWQTNPSIATLTVVNNTISPQEVIITLLVKTSDGRQVISGSSSPTVLLHGPNVLNNTSLLHGNLKYYDSGIKNQIIQTGRIPEGTYSACVSIASINGVSLVSNDCRDFTIVYPDPPQLVYPLDGDSVNTNYPILQWTPVQVPIQYRVHYVMTMVQLLPGQIPSQALAADVPQYTNGNLTNTALQYPISALPLVAGDTYVWQVQALDQNGFSPASNNGKSQIFTFKYQPSGGSLVYHPMTPIIPPIIKPLYTSTTISGTMLATFTLPHSSLPGTEGVTIHEPTIGGSTSSSAQPSVQPTPLANTTLELVNEFMLVYGFNIKTGFQEAPPVAFQNEGQVVATTTTDASGDFSFSVAQTTASPDTLGQNETMLVQEAGGQEMETGTLVLVYRIIVESPYYCSPDYDVYVQSGQSDNVGQLNALAKSYSLNVTLNPTVYGSQSQYASSPSDLQGFLVYMLRQVRPTGVPANEGLPSPSSPAAVQSMQVVAEATTDANGQATFSDLVQNDGPNDQYYIYASPDTGSRYNYTAYPTSFQFGFGQGPAQYPNYQVTPGAWTSSQSFNTEYIAAFFNSQYVAPTVSVNQIMYATPPKVTGYVYRSDNTSTPVASAQVVDMESYNSAGNRFQNETTTMGDGYFTLPADVSGFSIMVSANGFRDTTISVNGGVAMEVGEQAYIPVPLQPDYNVTGRVVDEQGNPVEANVTIGGGSYVVANGKEVEETKIIDYHAVPIWVTANTGFQSPAVSGNQQIIIDPTPYSDTYFPDTDNVNVVTTPQNLGTFVLMKQAHRIKVLVTSGGVPVAQAHVGIEGVWNTETDNTGTADTVFDNASNNFQIMVTAPDGKDFVAQAINAFIPLSKDWTVINDTLAPAASVSGKVFVGNTAISGADVFLAQQQASDLPQVRTQTDSTGSYVLHDVPFGTVDIDAAKSQSDIVGADTTIVIPRQVTNLRALINLVNFHLRIYDGMDITKLLGFPMEVTSLTESATGVTISGDIVGLGSNSIFAPSGSQPVMGFTNIAIDSGSQKDSLGRPYAVPKKLPMITDVTSIPLKIYGAFIGAQESSGGISIDSSANGGELVGPTYIDPSSFSFSGVTLPTMYLGVAGGIQIPTITSSGATPKAMQGGFEVSDGKGNSIHYALYGFKAVADSSESFVDGDSVSLGTTIHTDLANVSNPDVDLDIGLVVFNTSQVTPITSSKSVKIALEKWTLEGDKWSISQNGGFMIDSGVVQTGIVNMPFTGLTMDSTGFSGGSFQASSISLSGILPLSTAGQWLFGFNNAYGHWSLSAIAPNGSKSPVASISNLPGTAPTDQISISTLSLLSNGSESFAIAANSSPMTFYKVASFLPTGISVYPSEVQVGGTMNLSIPGLKAENCIINYTKPKSVLKYSIERFPIDIADVNGVNLEFANDSTQTETLDSTGFHVTGTVSENRALGFNAELSRTVDSTSVWVLPGQKFNIGKSGTAYLANIVGSMKVNSGSWSKFGFAGDLTGEANVRGNLGFVVYGDIIDTNGTLDINEVDSSIGGITVTYDSATGAFYGNVFLSNSVKSFTKVTGQLTLDIENSGWYFFGGANFSISKFSIELALLFGNHAMNGAMDSCVRGFSDYYKYSHPKALPDVFPSTLAGFYFEGAGTMPIPDIGSWSDTSANAGIANVSLSLTLGGDFIFAMTFSGTPSTDLGAMGYAIFADATATLSGDIGVVCGGVKGEITASIYTALPLVPAPPTWDWEAYGYAGLWMQAYVYGGYVNNLNNLGGCFPNCTNDSTCSVSGDTASAQLGVAVWFGSDSSGVHFTATGKASGS